MGLFSVSTQITLAANADKDPTGAPCWSPKPEKPRGRIMGRSKDPHNIRHTSHSPTGVSRRQPQHNNCITVGARAMGRYKSRLPRFYADASLAAQADVFVDWAP